MDVEDWDAIGPVTPSSTTVISTNTTTWDKGVAFAGRGRGRGIKPVSSDDSTVGKLAQQMQSLDIKNVTSAQLPANDDDWNERNGSNTHNGFSTNYGDLDDIPKGAGFGERRSGNNCYKCGEAGHMSRNCPKETSSFGRNNDQKRSCYKCGEEGHMSRDCTNGENSGGRVGGKPRGCFKCGEEGHMSRDCTNEAAAGARGAGRPRLCFKCQSPDHTSRDCPNAESGDSRGDFSRGNRESNSRDGAQPPAPGEKPRELYIPPEPSDNEYDLFHAGITTGVNFSHFENIPLQVTGADVPHYITSFEALNLRDLIVQNIKSSGYVHPTPVQKGAIPVVLARRDLIACAQTGSGKTAAYLVPVINILLSEGCSSQSFQNRQSPEVLILAPTRELAIQIHRESRKFAHNSVIASVILYGGTSVQYQLRKLQGGCNILVGTPGRLKDVLEKTYVDFSKLKFLILDEADRMLDMGFGPDMDFIVGHASMPPTGRRQTLMFSATFPEDVQRLANKYLDNYVFVNTGVVGGTNPDVEQQFFEVPRQEKRNKLVSVLQDFAEDQKTIVFVDSKKTADFIAAYLCNVGYKATSIHGDRLQSQRESALGDFKKGDKPILVATNVAARGLDIAGVSYVINYDLPADVEEYVHRIGRTGRVGNVGVSISFFDPDKDGANAGKLVEKLTASGSNVPAFLEAAVGGIGGMGYDFQAPTSGTRYSSRDMRRYAKNDRGTNNNDFGSTSRPIEVEESWD